MEADDTNQLFDFWLPASITDRNPQLFSSIFDLLQNCDYASAHSELKNDGSFTIGEVKLIRAAFSNNFLFKQQKEWSGHGIWRSFRFWSTQEKIAYLSRANNIISILECISPNIAYGFGSVLGFVRDGDFILHDDDMDLLVAFAPADISSYALAKASLVKALGASGLSVYNENRTHFTVNGVDVFVGFIEQDDSIAWFPSQRNSNLFMNDVFPPRKIEIHGVEVKIPRNPEKYLEATYGKNWRVPDSGWQHPWDFREYQDYDNSTAPG